MNIIADPAAKCFARHEIVVSSTTETVFRVLSDIKNWPSWQGSVSKAEINGPFEAGTRFKWKAGGLRINSTLHTVKPYSEIGWTGNILWIRAVHNWHIVNESNTTRVIVEESLYGPGSSFMRKSLADGMKKNLAELKARAENI